MPRVEGITFKHDSKLKNRYVTIDLKKYGDIFNPILKKVGALDTNFEEMWVKGIELNKGFNTVKKTISSHFV